MPQHLAFPHFHPPGERVVAPQSVSQIDRSGFASPSGSDDRWQVLKDKLAVAAVLLLVLATLAVFAVYLVHQAPYFRTGELTALATPGPAMTQQSAANANAAPVAGTGLGRIPLILISTVVEMGIFVALGLYLRHDMNRKR